MSRNERKKMIRRDSPELSLSSQCRLVSITRSSFYYQLKGENKANFVLMEQIDKLFMKHPFYGSRQMVRRYVAKVFLLAIGLFMLQAIQSLKREVKPFVYAAFAGFGMIAAFGYGIWQSWLLAKLAAGKFRQDGDFLSTGIFR